MKELTKAEEQIMQVLWALEKGFQKDIHEGLRDPRPAYTTVATVIRVLVDKGYIGFNTYGKVREYYPLVTKPEYSKRQMRSLVNRFFGDSYQQFASFFSKDSDLDLEDLEDIQAVIKEEIKKRKESE